MIGLAVVGTDVEPFVTLNIPESALVVAVATLLVVPEYAVNNVIVVDVTALIM